MNRTTRTRLRSLLRIRCPVPRVFVGLFATSINIDRRCEQSKCRNHKRAGAIAPAPEIARTPDVRALHAAKLRRYSGGPRRLRRTVSCKIVEWRATVDEDGHYSFAVPL